MRELVSITVESLWLSGRALSAESEGLRFDSSWGLRIFSLSHARDKTKKTSFFNMTTAAKMD